MDTNLVLAALIGERILNDSGILDKGKTLNKATYRVFVAADLLYRKLGRSFFRKELSDFLTTHFRTVYPGDLSTILIRLQRMGYLKYDRSVPACRNRKYIITTIRTGGTIYFDFETELRTQLKRFNDSLQREID